MQYAVGVNTEGSTYTVWYAVGVQCIVCMQYAVGVSTEGSTYTVGYAVGAQCAVCTQFTVGVSAKRSNPHSGVCSRYAVRSRC